jgi:mannose-6-phosphate isomerase-like protein (cupin superfamily)
MKILRVLLLVGINASKGHHGMPHKALHESEIEAVRDGRVKRVRTALGVTAFGINQFTLAPGSAGSVHDESGTGQEEVYLVLDGAGTMAVDGEELSLRPGSYVFVPPGTERQLRAGDAGLTYVCVGSPPGRGYEPRR